jgi:hypothetical protein
MKVFTMKFCINCKHFSPAKDDPEHQYARCSHNQSPSLITGTLIRSSMSFCCVARGSVSDGTCGAGANNYEEKEVSHV